MGARESPDSDYIGRGNVVPGPFSFHDVPEKHNGPFIISNRIENLSQAPKRLDSSSVRKSAWDKDTDIKTVDNARVIPTIKVTPSSPVHMDPSDLHCGCLECKPDCIQKFRTIKWVLFFLCIASFIQGMIVNGLVNVVISTLERRFDLMSTESGLIASTYDIAYVLCAIPVTYLGGKRMASKPRWFGFGVFIMGLGSLIFTIPHFITPNYLAEKERAALCVFDTDYSATECKVSLLNRYKWFFYLGQFLHGVGATPLYTLGITYIDENAKTKMSSLYIGIFYTSATIGPALGYVIGGQLLKIYTDFHSVDYHALGLTSDSNVWVGAWWIGFLILGMFAIIISLPLMCFPRELPGSHIIRSQKVDESYQLADSAPVSFEKIGDLPKSLKMLLMNPTFICLNLAGAFEGQILAGFATFLPKMFENQFGIPASLAALIVGAICIPAGGGGTLMGGYILKKFHLTCAGIIKYCLIIALMALPFCFTFLLSCDSISFAGINVPYVNSTSTNIALENPCNVDCHCNREFFEPVCGIDNVLYYNPCFAGCESVVKTESLTAYLDCQCIPWKIESNESSLPNNTSGTNERCHNDCHYLPYVIVLFFVLMVLTFLTSTPSVSATLRCVPENQRSFALGVQWIKIRVLGSIPAPVIIGRIMDLTCVSWQSTCEDHGSCRIYDNFYMSRYLLFIAVSFKGLSSLFFFLSWKLYKPPLAKSVTETTLKTLESVNDISGEDNYAMSHVN